ncbi:MAG TPA: hypothetical protein VJT31_22040, partial [Rugosimonospora sp.]|nr:hypothetical protein [Rugosimonospora sp.]
MPLRSQAAAAPREAADPEAVRAAVEQFELGVALAMNERDAETYDFTSDRNRAYQLLNEQQPRGGAHPEHPDSGGAPR